MKIKTSNWWITAAVVATGVLLMANAAAQSAFAPPVLNAFGDEPTGNDGFLFTPNTPIWVTSLGYVYPGTVTGNIVGLFDVSAHTLLASAVITGAAAPSGNFLYQDITPVSLSAGHEYAIVGLFTVGAGAVGYFAKSGMGVASEISCNGYLYDYNPALDLPNVSYNPPIFGPNFQFTTVPEPGVVALAGGGVLAAYVLRRKKSG